MEKQPSPQGKENPHLPLEVESSGCQHRVYVAPEHSGIEVAAEYVKNLTGKDVKSEDEIEASLVEQEAKEMEENEDAFYSFHMFTIIEED